MGGGRRPVRTNGGDGRDAITICCVATMRGGATASAGGGGGGKVVKPARTHEAHFRLSIGDGFSGWGVPSAL